MNWTAFGLGVKILATGKVIQNLWILPNETIDEDCYIGMHHIANSLSNRDWLEEFSFADLLHSTAGYDATDPRDKIYALLGCSSAAITDFEVDYRRSISEIITHLSPLLFLEPNSLDPLSYAQHEKDIPEDVPSWASKIDVMYNVGMIADRSYAMPGSVPQQYGGASACFQVNSRSLRIAGRVVASVCEVSEPAMTASFTDLGWQRFSDSLSGTVSNFVLGLPTANQPTSFRSLIAACICGLDCITDARTMDTHEKRDNHGRLLLAVMFYNSPHSRVPPRRHPT